MSNLEVKNPSTGEVIATYLYTDEQAIHSKIERAHQAFLSWRDVDAHERSRLLWAWSALIKDNREALARLITLEGANLTQKHSEK